MNKSSIAYKINIGTAVLVGLLLLLGLVSFLGVSGMMGSVRHINNGMVKLDTNLKESILEISSLERMMETLKETQEQFAILQNMQQSLEASKKDTEKIGIELEAIQKTSSKQTKHLGSIKNNSTLLINEINILSIDIKTLTTTAERINKKILRIYIGFFNYLNEFSPTVDEPLEDIKSIYEDLEIISELFAKHTLQDHIQEGQASEILEKIKHNLKRFRYYMKQLGETSSTTQISELKKPLVKFGTAIISATDELLKLSNSIADSHINDTLATVSKSEKTTEEAVNANKVSVQIIESSVGLTKESSKNIGNMTDQLSLAIAGISEAMQSMPEAIKDATGAMVKLQKTVPLIQDAVTSAKSSVSQAIIIRIAVLFVCLAAVAFGVYVGLSVNKKVVLPLTRFTDGLHRASQNNLTVVIDPDDTDGELRSLIEGTNNLIQNFQRSVLGIKSLSGLLAENAGKLGQTSKETADSLKDQNQRTVDVSVATDEITKSSNEIAQNIVKTEAQTKEVSDYVRVGENTIGEMTQLTEEINTSLQKSIASIQGLKADSDKIGSIITIINEIADQTNLLALNATIEAARAGEHGRGFSVVAEEVKQLAKKTSASTKGVSEIIDGVRDKIIPTLKEIALCGEKVNEDQEKCFEVSKRLNSITSSTETLLFQTTTIANATEEQSIMFPKMEENLQNITKICAHTSSLMNNVEAMVYDLNKLSQNLLDELAHFKVN